MILAESGILHGDYREEFVPGFNSGSWCEVQAEPCGELSLHVTGYARECIVHVYKGVADFLFIFIILAAEISSATNLEARISLQ